MGCAVGGASFELARAFPHVLGLDYSQHFVDAANVGALMGGRLAGGRGGQAALRGARARRSCCGRPCMRAPKPELWPPCIPTARRP